MRALRFHKSGALSDARVEEVPKPAPGPGEVLVRVRAAAVNPSDVRNVQGGFPQTTLPRTPGRDFAGVVEAGPSEWVGREVFGTGGGLGFTRDGSHAEFLAVPVEGVVEKPARLSFEEAAAVGVGYMTAWSALVAAGQLRGGETALILGVTGAVGSAGAAIARHLGARVLGTVRRGPEAPAASGMVDRVIDLNAGPMDETVLKMTDGRGADVILDVVGGPLFEPCMKSLAHRGRHVVIAAPGDPHVGFDLRDFYHREGRLLGVDTLKLTLAESAAILRQLAPGFDSGAFRPPAVQTCPLAEAPGAYARLYAGDVTGKLVLVP
jgi:NADPH:quinone reductase-like Zn-dependent oxidoreductase